LNNIYTNINNYASYSADVASFLKQKKSLSVHKRKRKIFPRRKWIVPGPYHTICADLIDYQSISSKNSGYNFILVIIDAFSRFAFTRPLKRKSAEETASAIDEIIQSMPYPPSIFVSDKGREFEIKNRYFHSIMEKYHIIMYYAKGVTKNAIVERWNRTFKTRLERYFTEKNKERWIDVLSQFTTNINNSKNRSIGMSPAKVTFENAKQIFKRLHPNMRKPTDCKLRLGDMVRKAIEGNIFTKVS